MVVVAAPARDLGTEDGGIGFGERKRHDAQAQEQLPQLLRQGADHPLEAERRQVRPEQQDQTSAGARPGGREVPHLDQAISLGQFKGKPVLVVFYLGAGCSHCIEQLNILAPLAKDFARAGIELVAISTDTPQGLDQTFQKAKDAQGFPFPIVSDHELDTFKAYRAFDDFEGQPLHGTFLIDPAGQVRWQNVAYRPFSDIKWLLGEAQRLLNIPTHSPTATAAVR